MNPGITVLGAGRIGSALVKAFLNKDTGSISGIGQNPGMNHSLLCERRLLRWGIVDQLFQAALKAGHDQDDFAVNAL
jgi:hypothetical protein